MVVTQRTVWLVGCLAALCGGQVFAKPPKATTPDAPLAMEVVPQATETRIVAYCQGRWAFRSATSVKLTFILTNRGEKPVKLHQWHMQPQHVRFEVIGPDGKPRPPTDADRYYRRPSFKAAHFPVLAPGESTRWTGYFPGMGRSGKVYRISEPGTYRVKAAYVNSAKQNRKTKLAAHCWVGSVAAKPFQIRALPLDEHANAPEIARVEQLVRKMGDDNYHQREAAGKALLAMGSRIVPMLGKYRADPDAEIAARVGQILSDLRSAHAPPAELTFPHKQFVVGKPKQFQLMLGRYRGKPPAVPLVGPLGNPEEWIVEGPDGQTVPVTVLWSTTRQLTCSRDPNGTRSYHILVMSAKAVRRHGQLFWQVSVPLRRDPLFEFPLPGPGKCRMKYVVRADVAPSGEVEYLDRNTGELATRRQRKPLIGKVESNWADFQVIDPQEKPAAAPERPARPQDK